MDEPCSALDPIATARIEELMQEIKERLHDRDRDPQHAAGRPGQRPHRVLHRRGQPRGRPAHRRARRVRRDRSRSSRTRPTSAPRTTSPADSDDGGAPWLTTFARSFHQRARRDPRARSCRSPRWSPRPSRGRPQVLLDGDLEGAEYLINADDDIDDALARARGALLPTCSPCRRRWPATSARSSPPSR